MPQIVTPYLHYHAAVLINGATVDLLSLILEVQHRNIQCVFIIFVGCKLPITDKNMIIINTCWHEGHSVLLPQSNQWAKQCLQKLCPQFRVVGRTIKSKHTAHWNSSSISDSLYVKSLTPFLEASSPSPRISADGPDPLNIKLNDMSLLQSKYNSEQLAPHLKMSKCYSTLHTE